MSKNDKIPKSQLTCLGDEKLFLDKQTDKAKKDDEASQERICDVLWRRVENNWRWHVVFPLLLRLALSGYINHSFSIFCGRERASCCC